MNFRLHVRSVLFFWRTNLGVILGSIVGTAVLTGALIVGDSMRESLRAMILGRLGRIDHALVAPGFFREELASKLAARLPQERTPATACPLILLNASISHAETQSRANRVNFFGVDDCFWKLAIQSQATPLSSGVILNQALASELGAKLGDSVLIHTTKPSDAPLETLLGRRDETTAAMRMEVSAIVPVRDISAFDLNPRQALPFNAFVPLASLQRTLHRANRTNAIFLAGAENAALDLAIRKCATLADYGFTLRVDERGYISLESERMLLPPAVERAALEAAGVAGAEATPIVAYLANSIEATANGTSASSDGARAVPYSTAAALDPQSSVMTALFASPVANGQTLTTGEIILNQWTAEQLSAAVGDRIRLVYYVSQDFGRLETDHADFSLRAIVPMRPPADDPGFIPQYPGITDAKSLADWNPPFPIDLKKIRPQDDDYWKRYRTAPKAFLTLADAERLWSHNADRFGRYTSIRMTPQGDQRTEATLLQNIATRIERELLDRLEPEDFGLTFEPIRQRALQAAQGSTDFAVLFLAFSFFLIASAGMLIALLFRLSVERRSTEIGLLLATGYTPRRIVGGLIVEGVLLSMIGSAFGLALAIGYAWLMLRGLRSWWGAAVNAPFLELHASWMSFAIGLVTGLLLAAASTAWSLRGLTKHPPRALLAGSVLSESHGGRRSTRRAATVVAIGAAAAAFTIIIASRGNDTAQVEAFFGAGGLMLVAGIAFLARWLSSAPHRVAHHPGLASVIRLGIRNAPRHRGRSLLTAGLLASASFLIVSLEAMRFDPSHAGHAKNSGTGGFALIGESTIPILADLNDPKVRADLALKQLEDAPNTTVFPFRLKPGDESSCLNLYRPTKPRILGATDAMTANGGFAFAASTAATAEEKANPWILLNRIFDDGAIPAIGDEASVLWQMHLGLGKDLELSDERGRPIRLRFVGLLKESTLQSEVIIAERQFTRTFSSIAGYSFFLIDCPLEKTNSVEQELERGLAPYGFDAVKSSEQLARYLAVQNTYLSTFQTLGGIGLILGAAGLSAVMLRNIWERRRELALLRTVGFSRFALTAMVLAENIALLIAGLLVGIVAALVAVAPRLSERPAELPWQTLTLTLGAVVIAGIGTAAITAACALRAPIISALRVE